ncbi:hypothetical protein Tco_0378406 [Tanacetum coccineum]
MQIAQPGMNMDQDRKMLMVEDNVGNQFRPNAGQIAGIQNGYNANGLSVVPGSAIQNRNGNVATARAEGNGHGKNENQIRCYNYQGVDHYDRNCIVKPRKRNAAYLQTKLQIAQKEEAGIQLNSEEFDFMAATGACDEIEEVTMICTLKDNLQQASTSGTQTDSAPVYDSDRSAEINALHLSSAKMITTLNEEIANLNNQLSKEKSTVSFLNEEKKRLKSDFKIREDELLDKQIQLENKIKDLDNILICCVVLKNYVRKFLRALHPKWRAKVTTIEESKDLTSLSLDELIGNLKKESSDEDVFEFRVVKTKSTPGGRGLLEIWRPILLLENVHKPQKDKDQRDFVGALGVHSGEEDDEKVKDETCLIAHASSEVCSETSHFSDENSSIDDLALDNEYDKLCKMSLKIITKNKRLKDTRNSLENELRELKDKLSILEKNKGVDLNCAKCHALKIQNEKLEEESTRLNKFEKSTHCLNEMLSN